MKKELREHQLTIDWSASVPACNRRKSGGMAFDFN